MEQDIISRMTPTDWFLVAVVLALIAFTIFIVYLALEDPIKNYRKHREVQRKLAEAEATRAAAEARETELPDEPVAFDASLAAADEAAQTAMADLDLLGAGEADLERPEELDLTTDYERARLAAEELETWDEEDLAYFDPWEEDE